MNTLFKNIDTVKTEFNLELCNLLDLIKVPAPLFVSKNSGLNDNLTGIETKVEFSAKNILNSSFEVVQSLAKWKRFALQKFKLTGIVTDMVAIRKDEIPDITHSIQVEQWDWEHVLKSEDERTLDTLYSYATKIFKVIKKVDEKFNNLLSGVETLHFESFEDLHYHYPMSTDEEIVSDVLKKHRIAFFSKIGTPERAPDYDDWTLNGDLYVWDNVINAPLELSSMGIRVNAESLRKQLIVCNINTITPYHSAILTNKLPLTIGGGIGKNRLCMYLLKMPNISDYVDIY